MAYLTLLVLATALVLFAFWRRSTLSRRHRVPPGLKELPGPKGMATCPAYHREVPQVLGRTVA